MNPAYSFSYNVRRTTKSYNDTVDITVYAASPAHHRAAVTVIKFSVQTPHYQSTFTGVNGERFIIEQCIIVVYRPEL